MATLKRDIKPYWDKEKAGGRTQKEWKQAMETKKKTKKGGKHGTN